LLATGKRILDQIVDVIKRDFVDARENFESPRRLVLEKNQDCGFDGGTAGFHAGNLLITTGASRGNVKIVCIQ
jgi:hypothetical protein